jgi:hypothetical protein
MNRDLGDSTDTELEQRLEELLAGYSVRPPDTAASWRAFTRLRAHAARSRRRRLVAAGAAAAVAVVAVLVPVIAHRPDSTPAGTAHQHSGPPGRSRLEIAARIPVPDAGGAPGDTAMAGAVVGQHGQVWTITYAGYLLRLDPRANRVTLREPMSGASDLAAGAGALWVLTKAGRDRELLRIDPASGRIVTRFPLPRPCGQVSYAAAQLWLACGSGATEFMRLDPATGRVLAQGGPAYGVSAVAATPDGIWYSGRSGVSGFVGTGGRLHWVKAAGQASQVSFVDTDSLVYGQGALWAFSDAESVAEIDPVNGRVVRVYNSAAYDPAGVMGLDFFAVGLNSLWFLNDDKYDATSVLRVSLTTGRPTGQVARVGSCGEPCWQIYFANGSAWVPTETDIARISPAGRSS